MKIIPDPFSPKPSANNTTSTKHNSAAKKLVLDLTNDQSPVNGAQIAISERMIAQARGIDQTMRNAQDAASMAQTAEGALGEVNSALQQMRELSVQSANGTYTAEDRSVINSQFQQLKSYIDDVGRTAQYNTKDLFGSANLYQTGANEGSQIVSIVSQISSESLGLSNTSIAGVESSADALGTLDSAMSLVTSQRNSLGTLQNGIDHHLASLATGYENLTAASSSINNAQTLLDTIKAASALSPENMAAAHANFDPLRVMSLIND
ncbi:MAG: flagellin [Acidobacteriota bacterium]